MSSIIWVLIPLAAILGWIIVEVLEYKYKIAKYSDKNNEEFSQIYNELKSLKKRIENLEAIVTEIPDGDMRSKSGRSGIGNSDFIDDIKEENREQVHRMAKNLKQKSE